MFPRFRAQQQYPLFAHTANECSVPKTMETPEIKNIDPDSRLHQSMINQSHFLEYTLSVDDVQFAVVLFSIVWISIGTVSAFVLSNNRKRMSWVISLVNSFVLMVVGAAYLIVKVPTFDNFFAFGDNKRVVFHSLDNVSVLVCIWFALANFFDLVFGVLFYKQYLDPLTAYAHHTVYIWILITAMTGNGGFAHFEPFAAGPVYMFIEEMPTFMLALGSVFPSLRTDVGFGVTFLVLRLIYHAYMLVYSVLLGVDLVIPVMYVLTMMLHVFWFYTWMRKYGIKLLTKGFKAKPV